MNSAGVGQLAALFRRSEPSPPLPSLPPSLSLYLRPSPTLSLSSLPFSLRNRPLIAARRSGEALKLPQRVRILAHYRPKI